MAGVIFPVALTDLFHAAIASLALLFSWIPELEAHLNLIYC